MNKSSFLKLILVSLAVLIIDGLLVAGISLQKQTKQYQKKLAIDRILPSNTSSLIVPQPQKTSSPSPASSASEEPTLEIDTSDWKIYIDNKYGFTIKYPKDWIVRNNELITTSHSTFVDESEAMLFIEEGISNNKVLIYDAQIIIELEQMPSWISSIQTWYNSWSDLEKQECSDPEVLHLNNNTEGIICTWGPEGFAFYMAYIPSQYIGKVYTIDARSNERIFTHKKLRATLKAMASSFHVKRPGNKF